MATWLALRTVLSSVYGGWTSRDSASAKTTLIQAWQRLPRQVRWTSG